MPPVTAVCAEYAARHYCCLTGGWKYSVGRLLLLTWCLLYLTLPAAGLCHLRLVGVHLYYDMCVFLTCLVPNFHLEAWRCIACHGLEAFLSSMVSCCACDWREAHVPCGEEAVCGGGRECVERREADITVTLEAWGSQAWQRRKAERGWRAGSWRGMSKHFVAALVQHAWQHLTTSSLTSCPCCFFIPCSTSLPACPLSVPLCSLGEKSCIVQRRIWLCMQHETSVHCLWRLMPDVQVKQHCLQRAFAFWNSAPVCHLREACCLMEGMFCCACTLFHMWERREIRCRAAREEEKQREALFWRQISITENAEAYALSPSREETQKTHQRREKHCFSLHVPFSYRYQQEKACCEKIWETRENIETQLLYI